MTLPPALRYMLAWFQYHKYSGERTVVLLRKG
jgi:hypothetical protein